MSFYKWFQAKGGDEQWSLILAEDEQRIIRERRPAFTTILAADNNFKDEMTSEDHAKVRYTGDFYVDFDASSIDEVIPQFQKFLTKLKDDHGVDLHQVSLFASGGKGFHVTVPQECFIPKVNPRGYAFLPAIYKEMAMELYVDTLDLRVYTARRGRMFRTVNVERPDRPGVHKVPLTVSEAFSITEETYRDLCSAPRHVAPPAPPELNSGLALLFASANDKVEKAAKGKKKSKLDANLLKKFGGEFPPSIQSLMKGEGIQEGVGFQKIAMQLALAAHSLGKTEEVFLELCDGLCENHASDGTRYNTPAKRRQELRRMYQYMKDNVCYDFSVGGVKSLMDDTINTQDLDYGGVDIGSDDTSDGDDEEEVDWSIGLGMKVTSHGIWKKTEEGMQKVCEIGLSTPRLLMDLETGDTIGYEVDYHVSGKRRGSRILTMDTFLSRSKFMQFTLAAGGASVSATDAQVGALADILRIRAAKSGNQVYTTVREGLDVVTLPDGRVDVIWADRAGVESRLGVSYRLVGALTSGPEYHTDLRSAPMLEASEDAATTIRRLLEINGQDQIAKMLGWFLACFLCQPIRHMYNQFPMMQVYGAAEAGKTSTLTLLSSLHYWRTMPRTHSASNMTPFALEALAASSGSMPFLLEEFKPREMRKDKVDKVKTMIRENYNGVEINKGRVTRDTGQSQLELKGPKNVAPMVLVGEGLENQTALVHRAIMVSLTAASRKGRGEHFEHCFAHRETLGEFGRLCMDSAMHLDFDKIRHVVDTNKKRVIEAVGSRAGSQRSVFNIAVVLTGLEFGKRVLRRVFGGDFDEAFDNLAGTLLGGGESLIPRAISEASKVLATLAHLSQIKDEDERSRLVVSVDYLPEGSVVHLNIRNAYTKYARYQRSLGEEVLFDSVDAFIHAMSVHPAVRDTNPTDSYLKVNATTLVYTFDMATMTEEGIPSFGSTA